MGVKIKDILKIVRVGTSVGSVIAPGGVGKVLDIVSKGLDEKDSTTLPDALKAMAEVNDRQSVEIQQLAQVCLALNERLEKLEKK